jgi:hypothetical protein
MRAVGEVAPVNAGDTHEIHRQVLQKAAVANQDDPVLVWLMIQHDALHAFFMGDRAPLEQFIQLGAQVEQVGNKLVVLQPAPMPREGGEGENQPGASGVPAGVPADIA